MITWIACLQGSYYFLTGIWPLIHMGSFESVTGPKTDDWLVKTVGLLVAVIGATLLYAGIRSRLPPEIAFLAIGSALALALIDLVYSVSGRISRIYLADAGAELVIAASWLFVLS